MTTTMTAPTRRRSLVRRGALGLSGAALVIGAGFAAAPAQAADTGISALESIKNCESGGNYSAVNASSGASGAYQFLDSTWQSMSASAGYATAASAPESVQDAAAIELYNAQGTTPWAASESCWSGAAASSTATSSTAASSDTAATSSTAASGEESTSATGTQEASAAADTATADETQTAVTVQDVPAEQPAQWSNTAAADQGDGSGGMQGGEFAGNGRATAGDPAALDQSSHGAGSAAQLTGAAC